MLPIVDANVILRYLLKDVEEQHEIARGAIDEGCEATVEVIAEVVYVLAGVYGVPRGDIADALSALLDVVYVERHDEVIYALGLYQSRSLDFIDCVLAAQHAVSNREVITFDKKLSKLV